MSPTLLLLLLLTASPTGGQGTAGCWTACQRHVRDQDLRGRVCRLCITAGRGDAWMEALAGAKADPHAQAALRSALTDPDWRVRWGALRVQARGSGQSEPRTLADWVAEAPAADEVAACVTAARAAALSGQSTAPFLKEAGARGPEAAARVWGRRDAVRQVLEVEVYAEAPAPRGEALLHLATFLGQSPARVLLAAMARRPESADAAAASALLWVADKRGPSVGRMLLLEARPEDQLLINRLFAVYSTQLEALGKGLASSDLTERRGAVQTLRQYGPLARKELERALSDSDAVVRRTAARGLAESEGLTLEEAAARGIREASADRARRRVWMEAAAVGPGCEDFLLAMARDTGVDAASRGDAVAALVDCDARQGERFELLSPFLRDAQAPVRAGAVRALALPRSRLGDEAVAAALEDPAPEVAAAALRVVGEQRQKHHADTVVALLTSTSAEVREAAVRAVERLGRAQDVKPLAQVLQSDPTAAVRVAAAEALGVLGGPFAASALSQALKDSDAHVQHVARRNLARLGFTP
ncbi:HEAT repeat domain-containing protein [Melittangium boletus]|uniref:HEAT repeat domain-containing protein n=1 Tax=Melittangium boletus TaxID=83453 RepID=UPI003DA3EEF9